MATGARPRPAPAKRQYPVVTMPGDSARVTLLRLTIPACRMCMAPLHHKSGCDPSLFPRLPLRVGDTRPSCCTASAYCKSVSQLRCWMRLSDWRSSRASWSSALRCPLTATVLCILISERRARRDRSLATSRKSCSMTTFVRKQSRLAIWAVRISPPSSVAALVALMRHQLLKARNVPLQLAPQHFRLLGGHPSAPGRSGAGAP